MMAAAHLSTLHTHTNHMGQTSQRWDPTYFWKRKERESEEKAKITYRTEHKDCDRLVLSVLIVLKMMDKQSVKKGEPPFG